MRCQVSGRTCGNGGGVEGEPASSLRGGCLLLASSSSGSLLITLLHSLQDPPNCQQSLLDILYRGYMQVWTVQILHQHIEQAYLDVLRCGDCLARWHEGAGVRGIAEESLGGVREHMFRRLFLHARLRSRALAGCYLHSEPDNVSTHSV